MPKSLVVCCDGTWDRPVERNTGYKTCTNVYKLWRGLADADRDGAPQRTFYHEGVGTGDRLDRILGGAFGAGLARNVCDCYRFLVLNYEPGDRVYLFGFSRGAYTARSVAGMVRNCGILEPDNFDLLGQAFHFYRDRGADTSPASERAQKFRQTYSQEVAIHFVGVWDTVGSLGVPVMIPIPFYRPWWAFHDTDLSSTVRNAFHAVAIDEQRGPFKPTLWTRDKAPPEQTLEQVWFAGCHRDVGGGVVDSELADITLAWMVERAKQCGLGFKPDHFVYDKHPSGVERYRGIKVDPDPAGNIHESLRGVWKLWRHRRELPTGGSRAGYPLSRQSLSSTAKCRAQDRVKGYPPPQVTGYLEKNLPITDVPIDTTPHQPVVARGAPTD